MVAGDLHHHTQLLAEQGRDRIVAQTIQGDIDTGMPGKGHFRQGHQQAAVAAIMVGEQLIGLDGLLNGGKKSLQALGGVKIRDFCAQFSIHLGQDRTTQAALAGTEIDEQQFRRPLVGAQLRSQGLAHIGYRGKGADNQRQRRSNGF